MTGGGSMRKRARCPWIVHFLLAAPTLLSWTICTQTPVVQSACGEAPVKTPLSRPFQNSENQAGSCTNPVLAHLWVHMVRATGLSGHICVWKLVWNLQDTSPCSTACSWAPHGLQLPAYPHVLCLSRCCSLHSIIFCLQNSMTYLPQLCTSPLSV